MRRKPGALVPLELAICVCARRLQLDGVEAFHGYEVAKHLREVTSHKFLTAYGTLYRALERLETMGLLESRWEDPEISARENRPRRRLYKLTAGGEAVVHEAQTVSREKAAKQLRRRPASA
jgi:PadR family transcriptional regulator